MAYDLYDFGQGISNAASAGFGRLIRPGQVAMDTVGDVNQTIINRGQDFYRGLTGQPRAPAYPSATAGMVPPRIAAASAAASGTEAEPAYTEPRNTRPLTDAELRPSTPYQGGEAYLADLRARNPDGTKFGPPESAAPQNYIVRSRPQTASYGGAGGGGGGGVQFPSLSPIQAELASVSAQLNEAYANSQNDLLSGMQAKRLEKRYANLLNMLNISGTVGIGQANADTQRQQVNTIMPRALLEADTKRYGIDTEAAVRREADTTTRRGQDLTYDTHSRDLALRSRVAAPTIQAQESTLASLFGGDYEGALRGMAAFQGHYPPAPTNMFVESKDTLPGQAPAAFNRQTGENQVQSAAGAISPEARRRLASGASAAEPGPNGTWIVVDPKTKQPRFATPEEARAARGQ
jgi:hypothetical protein